jgi:hypothetical protein
MAACPQAEALTRIEALLAPHVAVHAARLGVPATFGWPLGADVAAGVLAACDAGVVELGNDGRLYFPRLRSPWRHLRGWGLFFERRLALAWAESFTQLALAGTLVSAGWSHEEIEVEDDPFDVGAYLPGRPNPVVLAEAKRTRDGRQGAAALVAGLRELAGGPPAPVAYDRADAEKKYRGLVERRPALFAVTGPGFTPACFSVHVRVGKARLVPADLRALRRP